MSKIFRCNHCNSSFQPSRSDQKYCDRKCKDHQQALDRKVVRKRLTKPERLAKKLTAFHRSSFGRWLVGRIKSHGTVQILQGSTASDLTELYRLKTSATRFSGFIDGEPSKEYELSHIFSAQGNRQYIGLLKASNLVICPGKYNNKRKASEESVNGRGASLHRSCLKGVYSCTDTTKPSEIITLIKKLLGKEFEEFLLQNSFRIGIHARLFDEVKKYLPEINENIGIDRLKAIKAELGLREHIPQGKPAPLVAVLAHEMDRFQMHASPAYWAVNQVSSRLQGIEHVAYLSEGLLDHHLDTIYKHALDLLHESTLSTALDEENALNIFEFCQSRDHFAEIGVMTPVDHYCLARYHYDRSTAFDEHPIPYLQYSKQQVTMAHH